MTLEDYRYDAWYCQRCSNCKWANPHNMRNMRFSKICPSSARYLFDAYSSQGRLDIARAMIDGELTYEESPRLLDIIYRCTLCGACDVMCKRVTDLEPLKVLEELRIQCVKDGKGPMPEHRRIAESIEKNYNPYREPHEERFAWMPKDVNPAKKADVLYYAGCTAAYRMKELAQATVKILKAAGIEFMILGNDEWECGSVLFRTGQIDLAKKMMKHNIEAFKKVDVKKIITSCTGCYNTLKVWYPEYAGVDLPVVHSSEFIEELIKAGDLKFTKGNPLKVTYHDPCHLGRLGEPYIHWEGIRDKYGRFVPPKKIRRGTKGIYEPPRNVLKSIPGVELVEMERIMENSWCCGAGGGVKAAFNDFALWTATERLKEAKDTGANAIVSCCPFCKLNLRDAVKAGGEEIDVYDLMECVLKAIEGGGD